MNEDIKPLAITPGDEKPDIIQLPIDETKGTSNEPEFIGKLPDWNIEPPIEINRSEQ